MYAIVYSTFWSGRTGKALRGNADGIALAFYLMTNPHANMIGCYELPTAYLAHDLGLPSGRMEAALELLRRVQFVETDADWVWIREMARFKLNLSDYSLDSGDKRRIAAVRLYRAIGSDALAARFRDRYSRHLHLEAHPPPPADGGPDPYTGPLPKRVLSAKARRKGVSHLKHAWCAKRGPALCVPQLLHDEFVGVLGEKAATTDLAAWYAAQEAALGTAALEMDTWVFWRHQFRRAFQKHRSPSAAVAQVRARGAISRTTFQKGDPS